MKPGLAVLPLEVWADILVFPWINRQGMAQIVDKIGDREFAEKLQFRLHDMGKHTLGCIDIEEKYSRKLKMDHASLALVASLEKCECEFPETEMPENIRGFKQLSIKIFDYLALDFLAKIKSLFTNVIICQKGYLTEYNMGIVFTHLLPMLDTIRAIRCENDCMELLEAFFPGTLPLAKELILLDNAEPAYIPTYLKWLNAPHDFVLHGPRFLKTDAKPETITAIIDAVRKQFMAATAQRTFVIFLEFSNQNGHNRTDEFKIENATTKEQLTVRNAKYNKGPDIFCEPVEKCYVEILRHSTGADASMREWLKERAYYEKRYEYDGYYHEAIEEQVIRIEEPTIGRITKEAAKALARDNDDESANVRDNGAGDGPSTSKGK